MLPLLSLLLAGAPVAPPAAVAASPQEVGILLESVQPGLRPQLQTAVHGLGALPLYRVVASLDPATRTFHGEEQLRVPVREPTAELVLRLFNNASYLNQGVPQVIVSDVVCPDHACALQPDREPTLLRIKFEKPLAAGEVAAVNLGFKGIVPAFKAETAGSQLGLVSGHGGGPTDHGAFGVSEGVFALTGVFPQLAAHFGNAVDIGAPSGVGDVASYDVSNYLLTLDVPADFKVVAGGAQMGEEANPGGGKRFTFAAAALRDFPIYASNRWKVTSESSGGVTVSAYTLPGDEASGKVVLGVASRALADFSKRFGAYPWSRFTAVEQGLTDGAGGIEYPTVVGVASMLYRTQANLGGMGALFGPQQKLGSHAPNVGIGDKLLEFAVAHEVAHQWWSSLVGSDPRLHPSVDEPLAQYSAALYVETRHGKREAEDALAMQVAMNFQMMRQSNEADGPVDRPTDAFATPLQYAGLVYGKAPLFFRAVRKTLGDKSFDAALKHYVELHRFAEAGPDDFVLAAAEVAPAHQRELERLHDRWFEEAHGDEDVGPLDLSRVVEATTGMKMSAEEKAVLQQMMPQLMQMLQSGVDPAQLLNGGAPDPDPNTP